MAGKTRVAATIGGVQKQILSITERPNGDLMIFPATGETADFDDGGIAIRNLKYSVHRSLQSGAGGFTVKQRYDLAGDKMMDGAQFRTPGPDGLVALIYGRTVQDLSRPAYDLRAAPKDRVLTLFPQGLGVGTMFYFLVVMERNLRGVVGETKLNPTYIDFEHFGVLMLSGFLPFPPLNGCDQISWYTSLPRYHPETAPFQVENTELVSGSVQDAAAMAEAIVPMLAKLTANRMQTITGPDGEPIELSKIREMLELSQHFSPTPVF